MNDIAGICNAAGTIVGFMPHPERLAEPAIGSTAGQRFFTSLMHRIAAGVAA
jgi:phosphoribosylformylglycinamidine synthase